MCVVDENNAWGVGSGGCIYKLSLSNSSSNNFIYSPKIFTLHQNYPNPLNPTTTIGYELPESQNIKLQVFDITGRLVETLYNGHKEAGHWEDIWDASECLTSE